MIKNIKSSKKLFILSGLSVVLSACILSTGSSLLPPSISSSALAQNLQPSSQVVSSQDDFRGWSWDGRTASYVALENGKTVLYVRSFDGKRFGTLPSP
ncbi:MAG: hypothetical protein V7K38_09495 [Nostoc sp.]|uniref:hypothetical protein n=1 Tax=Nostoc sp. TaxID=1180 RepID=UPI002FF6547F